MPAMRAPKGEQVYIRFTPPTTVLSASPQALAELMHELLLDDGVQAARTNEQHGREV